MAVRDNYANIATFDVTQSAADTLTFAELQTNLGIQPVRERAIAMVIDEIDYFLQGGYGLMTAASDYMRFAITISNQVTNLSDMDDRRILHSGQVTRVELGTAASAQIVFDPHVFQFFPPVIHAEKSLYLGLDSNGLASAVTGRARIYYRLVELTSAELIELTETFRLVG